MNRWLMKTEPDCYSIDDLEAKGGPDIWDGCRNYTVRNFMRDQMKPGDLAFLYHSSVSPAGIVGVMRVTTQGYPDPTQFEPSHPAYDPKSPADSPRWYAVDVELIERFPDMVTLADLRSRPELAQMLVLQRGQRLSVMPVKEAEWNAVLEIVRARTP
ncbi:MAG: EVE domain-containing protein [Fimbriimonadaceae bacterium]|nr:EVE domain-containing protein [Fimbriimonadaceae bacterium]QYK58804.1 MAG: EVE domain-containing protein [Fimbriimonadaceae bacterium]